MTPRLRAEARAAMWTARLSKGLAYTASATIAAAVHHAPLGERYRSNAKRVTWDQCRLAVDKALISLRSTRKIFQLGLAQEPS